MHTSGDIMKWVGILASVFVLLAGFIRADEPVDYNKQIKPILAARCFSCHSALRQEGGLRLDAASLLKKGGDSGQAITDGKSAQSLLIEKVTAEDPDERMPPEGEPLTSEQIALLRTWIDQGASAPDDEPIPADPRKHWAFQQLVQPSVPIATAKWVRNDVDRFIASQHKRHGLKAVDEAPRSLLLRRVYLDLIGLPPTRDELRAFLEDTSPKAFERAVDRLLDSPRYGERWARHWMDVWRYSDPSGYGKEIRDSREHIWRWRDWIVESLNADKGYDRMIVEMLAADEASPDDVDDLRATGFLARNWYKFNRNVWLDNIVEHSSKAFLGLTLNCARCHEHKYDPIAQHEYFQMRAFFETHDVRDDSLGSSHLVRAFDNKPTTPTYLFIQGDERNPDKKRALSPLVPEVLGGELKIEPIELPATAYYPALQPKMHEAALRTIDDEIKKAHEAIEQTSKAVEAANRSLANSKSNPTRQRGNDSKKPSLARRVTESKEKPVIADDFSKLDPIRWTIEGGNWTVADGWLIQDHGDTTQYRLISKAEHPRDFRATLSLQITGGEVYRSVGLGFDVEGKTMNAVYLSAGGSKVQITLQDAGGKWAYPQTGAKSIPIKLNQDYVLQVAVRDRLMNVLIDNKLLVAFALPANRKPGKISVWTFSATAKFDSIQVEPLAADVQLAGKATSSAPATKQDLQAAVEVAKAKAKIAELQLAAAQAGRESLTARYKTERVKYGLDTGDAEQLALAASREERVAAVKQFEELVARDRLQLSQASGDPKKTTAANKNLAAHEKQLADAQAKLKADSTAYTKLGPMHPKTSTGRRLALARWITGRQNPLAARVAVNHIWLRHFDQPLVERMFDFGLRSPRPDHTELLDWLAVRFMEEDWSMKKLHKLIVTSGVYRLSSSYKHDGQASEQDDSKHSLAHRACMKIDPDNHFLWRMNVRRAEAEAVRDSMLHLGGSLDVTMSGPPITHNQGQTVLRRSIYFRQDKERQMIFLSLFDGAKVNECYRRKPTVAPQQALAMYNSRIAATQSQKLAAALPGKSNEEFVTALFEHVLCREPTTSELKECVAFLSEHQDASRARQQLTLVLFNHNDFVTVR